MELKLRQSPSALLLVTVLIVPYGIEIGSHNLVRGLNACFNRTLWN